MNDPFASVANNYDIMIDWPARLSRERPFFDGLIAEHQAERLLDIGCGTGYHSRMFAEMGMNVVGIDPSEAMLARAREITPGNNPRFVLGGFEEIQKLPEKFDLAVVLGNTLAYAKNADDLTEILQRIRQVLTPAGMLCLQVVNYDSVLAKEDIWLPLINRMVEGREYLFLREYRRVGEQVEFSIITLAKNGEWQRSIERSMHFPITGQALSIALGDAGFKDVRLFGDFQRTPYQASLSSSLIAVATL